MLVFLLQIGRRLPIGFKISFTFLSYGWRFRVAFSKDDVLKLANLAKIDIHSSDETGKFNEQTKELQDFTENFVEKLDDVMQLVNEINVLDTEDIEPMAHPIDMQQPLREDVVQEHESREELQNSASESYIAAGLYLVPKVVET